MLNTEIIRRYLNFSVHKHQLSTISIKELFQSTKITSSAVARGGAGGGGGPPNNFREMERER